jgi:hypothetical protein
MSQSFSAEQLVGRFVKFSAVVTAFTAFDLYGTGQVAEYFSVLLNIVGEKTLTAMFDSCFEGSIGS